MIKVKYLFYYLNVKHVLKYIFHAGNPKIYGQPNLHKPRSVPSTCPKVP